MTLTEGASTDERVKERVLRGSGWSSSIAIEIPVETKAREQSICNGADHVSNEIFSH